MIALRASNCSKSLLPACHQRGLVHKDDTRALQAFFTSHWTTGRDNHQARKECRRSAGKSLTIHEALRRSWRGERAAARPAPQLVSINCMTLAQPADVYARIAAGLAAPPGTADEPITYPGAAASTPAPSGCAAQGQGESRQHPCHWTLLVLSAIITLLVNYGVCTSLHIACAVSHHHNGK